MLSSQSQALPCTPSLLLDLRAAVDSVLITEAPRNTCEIFLMKLSRENQYLDIDSFPVERFAAVRHGYGQAQGL